MADTKGTIKLEDLIDGFLWKAKLPRSEYRRLLHIACDGVRELNVLYAPSTRKETLLYIDSNLVVDFPDDFENFIAIGVPYQGKFFSLTRDQGILDPENNDGTSVETNVFYPGYGSKGGVNLEGYYRVDFDNRRILFKDTNRDHVLLIYSSSGVKLDSDTIIPTIYKEVIESYIAYEHIRYDLRAPESKKAMAKNSYDTAINKMHALTSSSLDEWYDTLLSLTTQAVQR